jgi:transcriptional regulator with XRE-family HTH domain
VRKTRNEEKARPEAASDIDAFIGAKIRRYRTEAGISQTDLGQASAITFQQVQKYENGTNRVSVARLLEIAATLGVPLTTFVEDLPDAGAKRRGRATMARADQLLGTEHGLRLVKAFLAIENQAVRTKLVELAAALAHGANAGDQVH